MDGLRGRGSSAIMWHHGVTGAPPHLTLGSGAAQQCVKGAVGLWPPG